jgi:hypothetical protein
MFHLNHYTTDAEVDAAADAARTADSSSSSRPSKLPRRDSSGFQGASAFERHQSSSGSPGIARETAPSGAEVQVQNSIARTRGITACQKCRSRKTRCDNQRPSCGYCAKLGVSCLYESDSSYSCVMPLVLSHKLFQSMCLRLLDLDATLSALNSWKPLAVLQLWSSANTPNSNTVDRVATQHKMPCRRPRLHQSSLPSLPWHRLSYGRIKMISKEGATSLSTRDQASVLMSSAPSRDKDPFKLRA